MKKALITGSEGFVGKYLRRELQESGYEVTGIDLQHGGNVLLIDLMNQEKVREAVADVKPDTVFHLAGQANVARSWKIPQKTMELNIIAGINLMDAVRDIIPDCRMVMVGSSDQYGNLGERGKCVVETMQPHPQTPYAISKQTQEDMSALYARTYRMNICMTRSFNHVGAGQAKGFLFSDFASGIAAVEKGQAACLRVGNLTARRDFTHVSDVVRAYRMIAERGRAGEVYNVGSGITYSAQEILDRFCALANCPIPIEQDPSKMRPSDTPVICCDHSKLTNDTGWKPEYSIDGMISDVLQDWRNR